MPSGFRLVRWLAPGRAARRAVLVALLISGLGAQAQSHMALAANETAMDSQAVGCPATTFAGEPVDAQGTVKPASPPAKQPEPSFVDYLTTSADAIHDQLLELAAEIPKLPAELVRGASRFVEIRGERGGALFVNLAIFVAFGFGAQWLFQVASARLRRRVSQDPILTVGDRLRAFAVRFALMLGAIGAFALGSLGPLLALHWEPVVRQTMLVFLIALLAIRLVRAAGTALLAPQNEQLRAISMATANAAYWRRRLTLLAGWFAMSWVLTRECVVLGIPSGGVEVIGYTLGLGTVAIALASVWHGPIGLQNDPAKGEGIDNRRHIGRAACCVSMSLGIVLLWLLWVAAPGLTSVRPSFWLVLVIMALPIGIGLSRRMVEHLLRPAAAGDNAPPTVSKVSMEHGIRALLIIAAAGLLAWGWDIDVFDLGGPETMLTRTVHGALDTVVILLLADVLWNILRAAVDSKLSVTADLGDPNSDEAKRRARLHTLLPIFRNFMFVFIVAVAVMMALAGLGVQIGPLLAGASVIGVAIGFGAQSFVRDVIAGIFYLLDDAFRVGEYIQSGNYKGTVEGFSIRSVRLRHHRGPVYTVPFSLLGAIQNQSRDWVIDKMSIGITYDSDIDKARKLIKQIGLELKEVPEFNPLIIEPLKMQGVDQFGDFAVKIRMKMMTLPGEQFVIRRKAYAMIKEAFDANGIKFALPTVHVAGDVEDPTPAAAKHTLELIQRVPAEGSS